MLSGAATWTLIVAASWLTLEKSDSSGWVGVIFFAWMIPFLLVSPIGGLMADLIDRRRLAMAMFAFSGMAGAALAVLTITDAVQLWHIAALAFIVGSSEAIQEPTTQALIPNQVPGKHLLNAVTLNAATSHGARFFGLAVAAPLLAIDFVGIEGVLVLSASFNMLAVLQMTRVGTVSRGETQREQGLVRSMVEGLVFIYTNQTIALFILLIFFHCSLVMSFDSILPIFSREELGATDGSVLGYIVMAFGVGALVGTFLLAGVDTEKIKGRVLLLTGLASGLTPMIMAASGVIPLAVVVGAAMGGTQATFMALTNTYVQSLAPDRLRGRIMSLYSLHAGGIMAFATLGYGFIADAFSTPPIFFVGGLLFVVVMLGLGARQPILRQVYRTGEVAVASP